MKKIMSVIATLILVTGVLAGCTGQAPSATESGATNPSGGTGSPAPSAGDKVFRINIGSEPSTADPGLADDSTSILVVSSLFDGLTRRGVDDKIHNAVAEKIDISEDGLVYTFHLRDSKWSNGDPVTAHDFEFAWKRALDPAFASSYAYNFFYIKNGEAYNAGNATADDVGVKALDDHTLEVHLENQTPFFLELTAFATYYPVHQKTVKDNPEWAMEASTHIGNGPYTLAKWEHKSAMQFTKNGHYWDKDNVKVDKVEATMIEDNNTSFSMFENGELDWAGAPMVTLPTDAIPVLKDSGKLQGKPVASTYFYSFNIEQPPFNNVKIRKAFSYAINRKEIVENILQTGQIPALGFLPPTMSVKPEGYFQDHDTQRAKQLLEEGMRELGISQLPPISVIFNTSDAHKKIAEAIQDQWRQTLGVDVKVTNLEFKVFLDTVDETNYQIARRGWAGDFNDPITFMEIFREKKGNNSTNWINDKYNQLLVQISKESDSQKRQQLFGEAEQILMDEMPIAPIYFYKDSWLQGENVAEGIYVDVLGNGDLKYVEMK